ncbi:Ser-Thr-rich glycosyl-phosphatidyl-inositol-anchored membrane family-domain-containing protein [Xylaria sp. FL1777]|nr:Ser-Thr-rich glycosyl-phosphatidyl-inositol-anchored membrane family-domain-containing protein [Xylaria sp. FL1777]
MRSSTLIASVLAFAASAFAQDATPGYAVVSAPGKGEIVPAGKTYTIKWSAGKFTGPATISLMGGNDPTTLVVLDPIASGVNVETESYAWKVDCSLGTDKTYGLKITDDATKGATFQYSFPFEIKGPSCDSTSTSVSSSASASGYPTSSISVSTSGYPTTSTTASTSPSLYPTKGFNSTTSATATSSTKSVKSTTAASTLTTLTTPVVIVTETPTVSKSSSGTPATSTTASSTLPTAGAARAGAGLALGLMAAALAL